MNNDSVNHPAHYTHYSVEVIDITRYLPFDLGNVVKYVVRAPFKANIRQDIEKALFYARDAHDHPHVDTAHIDEHGIRNAELLASELPDWEARIVLGAVHGDIGMVVAELSRKVESWR